METMKTVAVDVLETEDMDDGVCMEVHETGNAVSCGPSYKAVFRHGADVVEVTLVVRKCDVPWRAALWELEGYAVWTAMRMLCTSRMPERVSGGMGWFENR